MAGGWWRTPAQPFNSPRAGARLHPELVLRQQASVEPVLPRPRTPGPPRRRHPALPETPEPRRLLAGVRAGGAREGVQRLRSRLPLQDPQEPLPGQGAPNAPHSWKLPCARESPGTSTPRTPSSGTTRSSTRTRPSQGSPAQRWRSPCNPDRRLHQQLEERIRFVARWSQSPAGFFYDPRGMDINYNFEVMLPEMAELHLLTGNPALVSMTRKFTDWFGYNLLREPDDSGWLTYYAVSDRTATAYYDDVVPDPDRTNLGSFFVPAVPDLGRLLHHPRGPRRDAGSLGSRSRTCPTARETRHLAPDHRARPVRRTPAEPRRETARDRPPAVSRARQLHRTPPRQGREPGLPLPPPPRFLPRSLLRYETGQRRQVRHGLPLAPKRRHGDPLPANGNGLLGNGPCRQGRCRWQPDRGVRVEGSDPLPHDRLLSHHGTIEPAEPRSPERSRQPPPATEQIPLVLQPGDEVVFSDGTTVPYNESRTTTADGLVIRRGRTTITITWTGSRSASLSTSTRTYLRDQRRRIHVLRIQHDGALETIIRTETS